MFGKTKYWLIGSVALNAALLGVVGGRLVSGANGTPPPESVIRTTPPPRAVPAEVQAAWAKLPESDREVLGRQFAELWDAKGEEVRRLIDATRRVAELARQEPFVESDLRNAVVVYRHSYAGFQDGVDDVLISHLDKMPPDAREIAARGLLAPYSQWMRQTRDDPAPPAAPPNGEAGQDLDGEAQR